MRELITLMVAALSAFFVSQEWVTGWLFFVIGGVASAFGRTHSLVSWSVCFAVLGIAALSAMVLSARITVGQRVLSFGFLVLAGLGLLVVAHRERWGWHAYEHKIDEFSVMLIISYTSSWLLTLFVAEIGLLRLFGATAQQAVAADRGDERRSD
jgi:hypothetical protein